MDSAYLRVLIASAHDQLCALPLAHVIEIMRPLPCHPIPNTPAFVVGVSTVRSAATPVVDLGLLVAARALEAPSRLVLLRLAESRGVGLLVDSVRGIESIGVCATLPPLIRDAAIVQELGRLDAELLTVLDCGRVISDEQWPELAGEQVGS